jgi:hypothetical protein
MLDERFVRWLEWTVLVLIVVVLVVLFVEISVGYEALNEKQLSVLGWSFTALWALYAIDFAACCVFLSEFFLRLSVAEDKRWFWRHNWIDLVSSIPVPPFLLAADLNTLLRIFCLLRLMRIFRVARIVEFLWNGMERLERNVDVNLVTKSAVALLVLLLVGTSAVTVVEPAGNTPSRAARSARAAHAANGTYPLGQASGAFIQVSGTPGSQRVAEAESPTIEEFTETLWWTFNAIAPNAGYADLHQPTHTFTRLVTAALLLWGAVVMGAFVATLTASFNGERTDELRLKQLELGSELDEVRKTQADLKPRIGDRRGQDEPGAGSRDACRDRRRKRFVRPACSEVTGSCFAGPSRRRRRRATRTCARPSWLLWSSVRPSG